MADVAINSESAQIPGVMFTEQGSDPAAPSSGFAIIYYKGGKLYIRDEHGLIEVGAGFANPMTTLYDLIVGGADGDPARLAVGISGDYLTVGASGPEWMTPAFPSVIYNSAWSSPPGAPSTGELWCPSDGHFLYVREGAAWVPICRAIRGTTPPAVGSWTWVNQGTSTAVDDAGTVLLTTPNESSWQWRLLTLAYPTVPFVATARLASNPLPATTGNSAIGIGFRQAAAGGSQGYLHMGLYLMSSSNSTWNWYSSKFPSPSGSPTNYASGGMVAVDSGNLWIRIADDNSDRIISLSADGLHWRVAHTITRLDYLTPDQLVFGASGGGIQRAVRLLSWTVT